MNIYEARTDVLVRIIESKSSTLRQSRDEDPVLAGFGSGALYLKRREILESLLNKYFR